MESWVRLTIPAAIVLTGGQAWAERYATVEEAQARLFPGESLSPQTLTLSDQQAQAIEKASGVRVRVKRLKLWRAQGGGWFFVDEVLGKHEYITWALALDPDGAVRDLEVLEYRETYGYEVREAKWRAQFRAKRHGAPLRLDHDVRNISGATLSCRHIADGVKRLLATHDVALRP